jgi:alkylated DNA nucleotide flippase Atl1
MQLYADKPSRGRRAHQIYLVLIAMAHARRVVTYGEVAEIIGWKTPKNIGWFLGPIYQWVRQHKLPMLTWIVVSKATGEPSYANYERDSQYSLPLEQQRVFNHNWFEHEPPILAILDHLSAYE